jgi:hypothetical protein
MFEIVDLVFELARTFAFGIRSGIYRVFLFLVELVQKYVVVTAAVAHHFGRLLVYFVVFLEVGMVQLMLGLLTCVFLSFTVLFLQVFRCYGGSRFHPFGVNNYKSQQSYKIPTAAISKSKPNPKMAALP